VPKLSIIIPTYNSAATIERCLNSIRIQTLTDYEILIQEDGSSDRTVALIQEFLRENPGVDLKLNHEQHAGAYGEMNNGIRRANGDWLYFLGSDDELYNEDSLSGALGSVGAAGCDVLYGNVQIIGNAGWASDGSIYDGPFDAQKLSAKNICHQAMFYRAAFVAGVGFYNPNYVICADWDFNMRCWAQGARFRYVDTIVAKFHAGGMSTQNRPDPHFAADLPGNIARYLGKQTAEAKRAPGTKPARVLRALARRVGISR
jgi:GT2 family glycosyltransferase